MKVKTFTGSTIHEALTNVKEEMGDSVLILETRSRMSDGFGGMFGRKVVEVIVADDDTGQAEASPFTVLGVPTDENDDGDPMPDIEEALDQSDTETTFFPPAVIRRPEELTHGRNRFQEPDLPSPDGDLAELVTDQERLSALDELEETALAMAEAPSAAAENVFHKIYGMNGGGAEETSMPPAQLPAVLQQIQHLNGKSTNGKSANGKSTKGKPANGRPVNGKPVNGKPVNGNSVNRKSAAPEAAATPARTQADYQAPHFAHLESTRQQETTATPVQTPPRPVSTSAGSTKLSVRSVEIKPVRTPTPAPVPAARVGGARPKAETSKSSRLPDAYEKPFRLLLDQDLPKPMAKSLVAFVFRSLGPNASLEAVNGKLRKALLDAIHTAPIQDRPNPKHGKIEADAFAFDDEADDPWSILDDEEIFSGLDSNGGSVDGAACPDTPTIVALAGTSGVGKTSALAKIAAHFANTRLRTVGLISIETPHAGSAEQIDTYSELMGVQIRKVRSPRQLAETVEEMSDCAFIFMDTPACSLRRGAHRNGTFEIKHLKTFLSAVPGVQTHLVLSATTRHRDLTAAAKAFSAVQVDRLLFTKLDETDAIGHLIGLIEETGLPASYLTTGSSVTDDLEPATPEALAERIVEA